MTDTNVFQIAQEVNIFFIILTLLTAILYFFANFANYSGKATLLKSLLIVFQAQNLQNVRCIVAQLSYSNQELVTGMVFVLRLTECTRCQADLEIKKWKWLELSVCSWYSNSPEATDPNYFIVMTQRRKCPAKCSLQILLCCSVTQPDAGA